MGTNAFPDGLVYSLFVPTKMVDFKPEGQAEYIVKVTGLKFEGALFTLSNRGVWDLKDTRTRLPWGGFSLLVDPVAHEAYRAAWRDAMASVLETASFPCWHIGYKLSDRKDDTFKGVGLGAGGGRVPGETWAESLSCAWSHCDLYIVGDQVQYQGWWWEARQRSSGVAPAIFGVGSVFWRRDRRVV